jgi:DNA-binding HxlR family transcriptional regulator
VRAGAHALSLLAVPLNVQVITALAEEPRPLAELRRAAGSPPQTTMRGHMRYLTEIGVLERRRQNDFPGNVDYELGRPGRALVEVAAVLRSWLAESPVEPLELGSTAAKSAIKALADGWSSTIVRALAARPFSLTELNRLIADINYPSLERRLGAMRLAGQVEPVPGNRRGTPYAVTKWMRRAMGPLAAAAFWELRYLPEVTTPATPLDAEAAFLLAVPTLRLDDEQSGVCRLAVEMRTGGERRLAGVLVSVKEGRVASCVARLKGEAAGWASGSTSEWLSAVIEGEDEHLEVGGDCDLARSLLDGLHGALFRERQRR